jgi:hypothetical protein
MQIEHVHLLVNMQKCTSKICYFGNLVILHICKHVIAILIIIIILNLEGFNFINFTFINMHMQFMNLQFCNL